MSLPSLDPSSRTFPRQRIRTVANATFHHRAFLRAVIAVPSPWYRQAVDFERLLVRHQQDSRNARVGGEWQIRRGIRSKRSLVLLIAISKEEIILGFEGLSLAELSVVRDYLVFLSCCIYIIHIRLHRCQLPHPSKICEICILVCYYRAATQVLWRRKYAESSSLTTRQGGARLPTSTDR